MDNLNDLIVKRFSISYSNAGRLLLIPFGGLSILSIIVGKTFIHYPHLRRGSFLLSTCLFFVMMVCLYFLPNTSDPSAWHYIFIILFLISMSFAFTIFYAGVSPAISYIVEEESIGTAWGVVGTAIGLS